MPTYGYWLISLAFHAAILSVALPEGWHATQEQARAHLSAKLVPPRKVLHVAPPSAPAPRLGRVFHETAPKPATRGARVQSPALPRGLKVTVPATYWCRLPVVALPGNAPETNRVAVASVAGEAGPAIGTADAAPSGGEGVPSSAGTSAGSNGDGPIGMPSYSQTPLPAYPRLAKLRGWEGVTVLRVEVREDGRVGHVEMVRSSGHSVLDETAMKAVRAWRFEPARRGDETVACVIEVPIRFKLDNAGA